MNSKFVTYVKEARMRFHDDIVKPAVDAKPKVGSLPYMSQFTALPSSGTPARKDTMTGYLFTGHFVDQAIDRGLTEEEFKFIYKQIRDSESVWKQQATGHDQRYMFFSKSKQRAWIIRLLNRQVNVITCLPKGKEGNDDYQATIKKLIENKQKCDIVSIELN